MSLLTFSGPVLAQSQSTVGAESEAVFANELSMAPEKAGVPGEAGEKAPSEKDVPLNLETKKSSAEEGSPFLRMLGGLLVLGVLGIGALYFLRRYAKPGQRQNTPQIKVLTQHWLGPKKSLAIVRVAGESILIGVTDQNISMIKALALIDDEVPAETPDHFNQTLSSVNQFSESVKNVDDEDFTVSGLNQIKDTVSRRLKGMRSFQ